MELCNFLVTVDYTARVLPLFCFCASFPPTSIYYSGANLVSLLPHQGLYRYLESNINDHLLSLALKKCYPKWELSFKVKLRVVICNYCLCFCNEWYDVVLQKNLMEVEYGHCLSLALPFVEN
jgi:hypothetical protein